MIIVKCPEDIAIMREAGRIAGLALKTAGEAVKAGITTKELDGIIAKTIRGEGAKPSFLGYRGYTASSCISVNNEVIHGIPGKRRLKTGDVVSVDIGAFYNGFHGDTGATFIVGGGSPEAERLVKVTMDCFYNAVKFAKPGFRVSNISKAVYDTAAEAGFGVVEKYTGHGVGRALHEDPEVPNFVTKSGGARLVPGMTLAIEPMICQGTGDVEVLNDGWTVVTADGKLSAYYEHTVLITAGEPELLTVAR